MEAGVPRTAIARTAMLGLMMLAFVCLAGSAHPQSYSDELARRMIQRSGETNWTQTGRKHEFERMFRLYEPAQAWELPDVAEIPAEGRAVSPAGEQ